MATRIAQEGMARDAMADETVLITKEGLEKLQEELHELRTSRRAEVAKQIREAQELGMAQVIDEKAARSSKEVRVGSTVSVRTKDGKRQTYQLVGPAEADPSEGRISHESPVGRALLGKKRGDKVQVSAPAGKMEMTITVVK